MGVMGFMYKNVHSVIFGCLGQSLEPHNGRCSSSGSQHHTRQHRSWEKWLVKKVEGQSGRHFNNTLLLNWHYL